MTDKPFLLALEKRASKTPIWLMRQAGRYHSDYRSIKLQNSFDKISKTPSLSARVAIGPVHSFDFDCAILFSDILYILESVGIFVEFCDKGPILSRTFNEFDCRVNKIDLSFQMDAIRLTKSMIKPQKTMLGFVGGIATLYYFASGRTGRDDGLNIFAKLIIEELAKNINMQAKSGADVVCILDSALGNHIAFSDRYFGILKALFSLIEKNIKILYYAKNLTQKQINLLESLGVCAIGVDDSISLFDALSCSSCAIQGNFSNEIVSRVDCKKEMDIYFEGLERILPFKNRFINSLSHGVLKNTPEDNIKQFVELTRKFL